MTASQLQIGDKFKTSDDTIKIVRGRNGSFVICSYIPSNGYTVYIFKEAEVTIVLDEEIFKSNPDWKRNMFK